MLPYRISDSAVQTHRPTNVKHFDFWSASVSDTLNSGLSGGPVTPGHGKTDSLCLESATHATVSVNSHAEVSVPDLDGAVLAARCYQLPVAAVGAARGHHLLPLKGARFEHGFVLLL